MKRWVCLLLFILSFGLTTAQELIWSSPEKSNGRATQIEVIGQHAEGIFIARYNPREPQRNVLLERYTPAMRRIASKNVLEERDQYYATTVLRQHQLQLFYAQRHKENDSISIMVSRLKFVLSPETPDSSLFTLSQDADLEFLEVFRTSSSNDLLFLYAKGEEAVPGELHYLLVDSNISLMTKGAVDLGFSEPFEVEQAVFSGHSLMLLCKEEVKKKGNKQGYQYHLVEGRMGKKQGFTTLPLFNDTIGVTEGVLKIDTLNNTLLFAGLYNARDSGYVKGYYLWKRGIDSLDSHVHIQAFPPAVISGLSGKTAKQRGLYDLSLDNIILRTDGGIVFIAEEFQEAREMSLDINAYGSGGTFRNYYYYENLLVMSLNPAGLSDWQSIIRKEQVSVNDHGAYSSYTCIPLGDRLVFLYNDLSRRNVNLIQHHVTSSGSTAQAVLIKAQDFKGRLMPKDGKQLSYNELIIPGYARKGVILLKVVF